MRPLSIHCVARGLLMFLGIACAGCHPQTHTERNALVGSAAGALLGGVIGHQSDNTADGAVLGAMAGGLTGAVIGDAQDERDRAIAHASYVESAKAVTNFDLIRMTKSGVSDEVIINTVKTQGGRIDLSPDAVIELKANGVSDRIVVEIQQAAQSQAPPETVAVTPPPGIVIVHPVAVGVGYDHHHHHHRRHWHRPRTGFHFRYSR